MRNLLLTLVILLVSFLIYRGYSDGEDKNIEDHVWKEQTDALKKADQVNQLIQDAAAKKRLQIEQQTQQ